MPITHCPQIWCLAPFFFRTDSGEGDEFVFAYSTDDANYTDMLTVTKTIDDDGYQTFALPADTNGTVYVRVIDTDQTPGNNVLDTIFIDEMFVRSSGGGTALPLVTITATDASAAEASLDPGVFTVTRSGDTTDPLTVKYSIDAGSTATSGSDYQSLSGSVTIAGSASSATITVTPLDDEDIEGNETLTLNLTTDSAYIIGSPSTDTVTIADNDSGGGATTDDYAASEAKVRGTMSSGSYLDTFASDGGYEVIQERESGGKPSNRYSLLEHKWIFNVTGGTTVTFQLEAHRLDSGEGDSFTFAYSTDDVTYTTMVTVTKTADDDTSQTHTLPSSLAGTVYVRVTDNDRTPGNRTLDAVLIDHMFFRSETALLQSAAAVDMALLAWIDLDSSDDKDTDPLTTQIADELALMMME